MHDQTYGLSVYLLRDKLLTQEVAQAAIEAALENNISLTQSLVREKILSSAEILACCINHFHFPFFNLENYDYELLKNPLIHADLIQRYRVLPLHHDENTLHLGIADPTQEATLSAMSFHTGLRIQPVLVSEDELNKILVAHQNISQLDAQLESTLLKISPHEENISVNAPNENDEPITEFVNRLIEDAINKHISDIHIEPFANHCRIRFRRDGLLHEAMTTPPHLASRIITRLKIMANLNIAERRLPQDGRIAFSHTYSIDIRINTCPTLFGEKIVLRILSANHMTLDINLLGMLDAQKEIFLHKLMQPQGLILVTGPTGSGKTITLYSALHFLNHIEKNISSVEDPVEIELSGINQVNVNPRINLDFSTVLRTLLRQDPDIIMLGEIRDAQTANIAMQAAQTGHLVLSTLHTNSAIETVSRLQSIGVATYHFISSVSLIIAQRLVRKLCEYCKILEASIYRAVGCKHCHQGYKGRVGIFELLPMTEKIAKLILGDANTLQLLDAIKQEQWTLLYDAGLEKIKSGETSSIELTRVLGKAS